MAYKDFLLFPECFCTSGSLKQGWYSKEFKKKKKKPTHTDTPDLTQNTFVNNNHIIKQITIVQIIPGIIFINEHHNNGVR